MGNRNYNKEDKNLPKIDLGYRQEEASNVIVLNDKHLFDSVAREWANAINRTKKTQARNFYDQILAREKEVETAGFSSVYPFIKMLNSKVAYGVNRKVVSYEFQEMMSQCLDQIEDNQRGEQTFKHFKIFFEAVLGFFKGSN